MGDAAKKKTARRPFGTAASARPGAEQNLDAISEGEFSVSEFAVSGPESAVPAPEPPAKDEPKKPKSTGSRKKKLKISRADEQGPEDALADALIPSPGDAAEVPPAEPNRPAFGEGRPAAFVPAAAPKAFAALPPENADQKSLAAGSFRDLAARKKMGAPAFWSDTEIFGEKPSRTCGLDSRAMLRAILAERDWLDAAMRRTTDTAARTAMAAASDAAREKFLDATFGSNQAAKDGVRALADRIGASPRIPASLVLFPDMPAPKGADAKQWDAARAALESLDAETGRLFARSGGVDGHRAFADTLAEGGDFESYARKVGTWPVPAASEAEQFGEAGTLEAFYGDDDADDAVQETPAAKPEAAAQAGGAEAERPTRRWPDSGPIASPDASGMAM